MKRWITIILLITFLFSATGCGRKTSLPKQPVTFYYPAADFTYNGKTEVIHSEVRDCSGYRDNMVDLLNIYLQGPVSETLRSPFPRQVTVSRYSTTANTAIVELSSDFAGLSGIDLTLACACIASTLFDFTQLTRVQISATDAQLDGQDSILLEPNDLYMVDTPDPATNQPENTAE